MIGTNYITCKFQYSQIKYTGTQPSSFINMMSAFPLQGWSHTVVTETLISTQPKILLAGPLRKRFANPCTKPQIAVIFAFSLNQRIQARGGGQCPGENGESSFPEDWDQNILSNSIPCPPSCSLKAGCSNKEHSQSREAEAIQ